MIDPFTYWSRVWDGWNMIAKTGRQLAETVDASQTVIASRSNKIETAFRTPWAGDYSELSRMVPEKVAAFSLSGNVVVRAWLDAQSAWWTQAQSLGTMAARGRAPTIGEAMDLWSLWTTGSLRAFEAGARAGRDALAPVHAAATANQRRLKR